MCLLLDFYFTVTEEGFFRCLRHFHNSTARTNIYYITIEQIGKRWWMQPAQTWLPHIYTSSITWMDPNYIFEWKAKKRFFSNFFDVLLPRYISQLFFNVNMSAWRHYIYFLLLYFTWNISQPFIVICRNLKCSFNSNLVKTIPFK